MSSNANASASASSGIGFLGALTLVFVVAKLWGVIDWPWLIVFSPVLFGIGITVLFIFGIFAFAVIMFVIDELKKGKR